LLFIIFTRDDMSQHLKNILDTKETSIYNTWKVPVFLILWQYRILFKNWLVTHTAASVGTRSFQTIHWTVVKNQRYGLYPPPPHPHPTQWFIHATRRTSYLPHHVHWFTDPSTTHPHADLAFIHRKKKLINFPVPSRDVTDQTLPGQKKGRVWSVTSRLGKMKIDKLFYSVQHMLVYLYGKQ
jgi:hypothetical protein